MSIEPSSPKPKHNHKYEEVSRKPLGNSVGDCYMITYQCRRAGCDREMTTFKRE